MEKEGVLQALFYQRKEWQHTYKIYPEVVLVDATYKLNDLRMPLYLMLCVDGNGDNKVVAMWVVSSEEKSMKAMVTDYFTRQWYSLRHQWVEGLKNNAKHLMNNTNNRLESINQKIKDVVGRRLDLQQFFKELLTYFDSMSLEHDDRAAMILAKVPVDLHKDNPLADYLRHLTPYAFSAVKKQHELSRDISIPDHHLNHCL
ncbi:LOW QUALITY PROTEIN: Zinc finger swim domain-containing protein 1 [Plakobranchus ocellatus]|uniref:Zinc finger swim domain-containing protein 1 n=1 Tax=Plakobranchus ocellatus TaxID=259542 RepID=A0AAV3YD02_9GAST|nr:LOW QUALITY PROTEIN: Zinc finger swim domain-containing protein 1 [Plakobranchus ocellatus]